MQGLDVFNAGNSSQSNWNQSLSPVKPHFAVQWVPIKPLASSSDSPRYGSQAMRIYLRA